MIMKKELEKRVELLGYFTKLKCRAQIEGQNTDYYDTCIEMTEKQIHNILENELTDFFIYSIQDMPNKYTTTEEVEQKSAQKEINNLIKNLGLLPIDTSRANISEDRILVIDINYLPSEYKGDNVDTIRESLEAIYGCKVLLIDGSRKNLEGTQINNPPVYFI
jgi:hypothetical protein